MDWKSILNRVNHDASFDAPAAPRASASAGADNGPLTAEAPVGVAPASAASAEPPAAMLTHINSDPTKWAAPENPIVAKLIFLRQLRDDAHKLIPDFNEQLDLGIERARLQAQRKHLTEFNHDVRRTPDDHPAIRQLDEKIGRLTAEIDRRRALTETRSAAWKQAAAVSRACDDYIRNLHLPFAAIPLHERPVPAAMPKGHSYSSAVEDRRRRLRELQSDLRRVETAPRPSSVAKQIAAAEVAKLAERGAPDVMALISPHGETVAWSDIRIGVGYGTTYSAGSVPDAVGLIAWLFRDDLQRAVGREIDELSDDENALTDAARADKLTEILGDMLAVGRSEEALICAAEAAGAVIPRRKDADPRAVLGLADELPGPERS